MAILVTGGAGFIGSQFIKHLLATRSDRIVCLDDFNDFYSPELKRANVGGISANPQVTVVAGNFCDSEAMIRLFDQHQVAQVVHLGAYAGVRASVDRAQIYQETNIGGTLALLEAARRHPVDRFLLVSSSTVYGPSATAPFVEDAALGEPASPYGASKRAAELFGWTYFRLHRVPVVCLRPFSVYGPALRPDLVLSVWAEAIAAERELPLFGDGAARRDFTYITDICDGLAEALDRPGVVGEAINLGNDEPIELREVIAELSAVIGKPARINRQPEKPGEMAISHADLRKAKRLLGYQPRVPFREGVRHFVDWFLDERGSGMA